MEKEKKIIIEEIKINQTEEHTHKKEEKNRLELGADIDCPKCGFYDCYFNGVCYECPDCGNQWGCVQ